MTNFDQLISAIIGLARAADGNEDLLRSTTNGLIREGLALALSPSPDAAGTAALLAQIRQEKKRLVPNCFSCAEPCGRVADYDMQKFWQAEERIRALKLSILADCRTAAQAEGDSSLDNVIRDALVNFGIDEWGQEELISVMVKVEKAVVEVLK